MRYPSLPLVVGTVFLGFGSWALAQDFTGYAITRSGTIEYEIERSGGATDDLRIQALVVGHQANGRMDPLLKSEPFEVLATGPSTTQLTVSDLNYESWSKRYKTITAGLQLVPRPGTRTQWSVTNLLRPEEAGGQTGQFRVHVRYDPQAKK